eukprot:scaffold129297_cov29-Tisochrysis_lutea.AAC.1
MSRKSAVRSSPVLRTSAGLHAARSGPAAMSGAIGEELEHCPTLSMLGRLAPSRSFPPPRSHSL